MAEHRIKFRGGWEIEPGEGFDATGRITLPVHWPQGFEATARLVRRFGCPPSRSLEESYQIELTAVPGMVSLRLNDQEIEIPSPIGFDARLTFAVTFKSRNTLEMVVDLGQIPFQSLPDGWGIIALVIVNGSSDETATSPSDCP